MLHTISIHALRAAFTDENYPNLWSGQETHTPTLKFVARLCRYIPDDRVLKATAESGFPANYKGDTLKQLDRMIEGARQKGFDQIGPTGDEKPSNKNKALTVLRAQSFELFRDPNGRAFISVQLPTGGARNYLVRSDATRQWLIQTLFRETEDAPSPQLLADTTDLLEAMALDGDAKESVFNRVAGEASRIAINLGRDDSQAVLIDAAGWTLTDNPPFKFYRQQVTRELPMPCRGKGLRKLKELLRLGDDTYALMLAFLLNCLRPTGPYFCLLVEGEYGSGKSFLCKLLKLIIDPRRVDKLRLPDNERELVIQANAYYLLVYDNASGMKAIISDALCSIATGGGIGTRRLFTDEGLHEIDVTRPFIINGIGGLVTRPDLMERAIYLKLPAMPADGRKSERQLLAEFEAVLPEVLGELYAIVACALRNEPSVEPPTDIRMADAAHFLQAAEPGTFLRVLKAAQHELMVERVNNHPIIVRLRKILSDGPFEGTMTELHQQLIGGDPLRNQNLPRSASSLSNQSELQRPAMKKAGIFMVDRRSNRGKDVRLWLEGVEEPRADKPDY